MSNTIEKKMIIERIGAQINIIKVLWYKKSEFMQFIVTQPSINYEWRCWSWMVDEINHRIIHVHKGFFNKKKKKYIYCEEHNINI